MKKLIFLLLLGLLVVTSCSLDEKPQGSITSSDAVASVSDASKIREYLYIRFRGLVSGSYIYSMEISTDLFNSSTSYGNRGGNFYNWEITASDGTPEGLWSHCYYNIALSNFLIEGIDKLDQTTMSDADKTLLTQYKAEATFLKGYSTFMLVERFSPVYDAAKASSQLGVMLVNKYMPTSDQSKYPGRSNLAETYTYIEQCIKEAETGLAKVKNSVAAVYLTPDAVTAFKARVALAKGDYTTAIDASTSLIKSGRYPLVSSAADMLDLWKNNSGKECIVQFWANYDSQSVPSSNDYGYYGETNAGTYGPDYIPEQWVIDLYSSNDLRFTTWFYAKNLTYGNLTGKAYLFNKFIGNPTLQSATAKISAHINKIKPFRIAEQYLIASEAYARKGGNEALSLQYLNDLQSKRITNFKGSALTGAKLLSEIKNERVRELIGEGYRFLDLKRWKDNMVRQTPQDKGVVSSKGLNLTINASDYRFLWPIPQAEIDANPQIKGQQNEGY